MPVPSDSGQVPVHTFNNEEFYGSSHPYSPPLSDVEEDEVEHIIIKTSYNPLSPENQHFKAPWNKVDNIIWSTTERSHAEAGEFENEACKTLPQWHQDNAGHILVHSNAYYTKHWKIWTYYGRLTLNCPGVNPFKQCTCLGTTDTVPQ
ncbi:uncharacterized protein BJ212DRAFT_1303270 [Suillus subaureus]|uniref:Uncharacterized protein n=1 Tax=Suillus subaureus TaxID=48587 RepID=A0A9P7J8E6_9AGAM|nr:uncharacterized protein BJ212DRAFT_1303270 [Suillus subaureus]KAG1807804.1 hypothetical protein BJ212DRAFT_1303270 [Suillus subaureus]